MCLEESFSTPQPQLDRHIFIYHRLIVFCRSEETLPTVFYCHIALVFFLNIYVFGSEYNSHTLLHIKHQH